MTMHMLLKRRSHTYRKLVRFQEAMDDADNMIALAPKNKTGYLHKAQVLLIAPVAHPGVLTPSPWLCVLPWEVWGGGMSLSTSPNPSPLHTRAGVCAHPCSDSGWRGPQTLNSSTESDKEQGFGHT